MRYPVANLGRRSLGVEKPDPCKGLGLLDRYNCQNNVLRDSLSRLSTQPPPPPAPPTPPTPPPVTPPYSTPFGAPGVVEGPVTPTPPTPESPPLQPPISVKSPPPRPESTPAGRGEAPPTVSTGLPPPAPETTVWRPSYGEPPSEPVPPTGPPVETPGTPGQAHVRCRLCPDGKYRRMNDFDAAQAACVKTVSIDLCPTPVATGDLTKAGNLIPGVVGGELFSPGAAAASGISLMGTQRGYPVTNLGQLWA